MSLGRMALALLVIGVLLGSVHYYLWTRLVRAPGWPAPWATALTTALGFAFLSIFAGFLSIRGPRAIAAPLSWVAFTWLGMLFLVLVLTLLGDLVLFIGSRFGAGIEASDPQRRVFLARAFAAMVGIVGTLVGGLAVREGLTRAHVKRVTLRLPELPPRKEPYRIVQLTDVHVGPTIGRDFIDDLVARVNALEPDLIAITGDLVDGSVAELRHHVASLGDLRAREGVFFVTGNHEYYSGADAWIAHLRELGIRVLRNERELLASGIVIAGVDDASAHRSHRDHGADFEKALGGLDPKQFVVLLAHQPKAVLEAARRAVNLQLSGHTHGGQIFPFNFFVRLQQPYNAGLFDHAGTTLYVSAGTGFWGPPMRLGTRSEITLLELHSTLDA